MKYIGIDLAWTYKNETGLCIFDGMTCKYLEAKVYSDKALVDLILANRPCVVSIDAPLVVNIESGGRTVDSLVMKTKFHGRHLKLYATSRSYMMKTFKAIRGEVLLEALTKEGFVLGQDIFETYPTGILLSMFPGCFENRYKISSKHDLATLKKHGNDLVAEIKKLGFDFDLSNGHIHTKKAYKVYEDMLDGIMCAINSYYCSQGHGHIFHDDSGMIALAKRSE